MWLMRVSSIKTIVFIEQFDIPDYRSVSYLQSFRLYRQVDHFTSLDPRQGHCRFVYCNLNTKPLNHTD